MRTPTNISGGIIEFAINLVLYKAIPVPKNPAPIRHMNTAVIYAHVYPPFVEFRAMYQAKAKKPTLINKETILKAFMKKV